MPNRLELPDDLMKLIEKREQADDRRQAGERSNGGDRRMQTTQEDEQPRRDNDV